MSPDATETFIESCDGRIVGRYLLAMSSRRRPRPASWREGPLRLGRSSPLTDVLCAARSCTRLNGGSQAVSSLSRTVYAPVLMYIRGLLFILCSLFHASCSSLYVPYGNSIFNVPCSMVHISIVVSSVCSVLHLAILFLAVSSRVLRVVHVIVLNVITISIHTELSYICLKRLYVY